MGPDHEGDESADEATLLFSEIDDASELWDRYPDSMSRAVREYHELLSGRVDAHRGQTVTQLGDSVHAVFPDAGDALRCAIDTQVDVLTRTWPGNTRLRARMGLHTGVLQWGRSELFGPAVSMAARIQAAANGGQILLSEATDRRCRGSLRPGEELRDLGPRALPGLGREIGIYEVVSAGLLSGQSLWLAPRGYEDIPLEQTRLIGRDGLIDRVCSLVRDERLVTLSGPGGVGKSRIAVRSAARSRSPFEDGVRFIDLSMVNDGEQVADVFLSTLHGLPVGNETAAEAAIRVLVSKRLLLVLDNCEHVLPSIRLLASAVIERCPWVHVLATSRERLGLRGEHCLDVPPLAAPGAGVARLDEMRSNAAIRLFVDRARMADAHFDLTSANATGVATICRLCGGLPLAIELAAARLDVEAIDELALRLPSVEEDAERVARSLQRSFELLSPLERHLFLSLAVFAGSFTREMAFSLVGAVDSALQRAAFDRLVRVSLVTRDSPGSSRFRLFDPARDAARELLDQEELDELWRRHAALMLGRAEAFSPLIRSDEESRALEAFRSDFGDHRQAVSWLFDHGGADETARMVVALFPFCHFQLMAEVYDWAGKLGPRLDASSPYSVGVWGAAALGAWFRGDPEEAIRLGELALASGAPAEESSAFWALQALFNAYGYTGRTREGAKYFMRFVADSRRSDDPFWRVTGLGFEVIGRLIFGQTDDARGLAESAVALARVIKNPDCTHWALHCLGRSLAEEDPGSACQAFEDAIAAARLVGSRWHLSLDLLEWAALKRQLGDLRSAAAGLVELLDLLTGSGNRSQLAQTLLQGARVANDQGDAETAYLLAVGRRGMPEMLRGPQEAAVLDEFLESVALSVGPARSRLGVRAQALAEQDLIILCRSVLEDIAHGRVPLPPRANRRLDDVTIVYTDLVASTELSVHVGDDRFLELMREHNAIVRRRLDQFGGTEFTHTGDGIGAVFRETEEAVRFAVGLQSDFDDANANHPDSALRVRIGIVRGQVLENEGNLFGQTVVRAVRVCAAAGAGQVLVAEDVTTATGPAFARFAPFGPVPLKGFGTSVPLYEAMASWR